MELSDCKTLKIIVLQFIWGEKNKVTIYNTKQFYERKKVSRVNKNTRFEFDYFP